MKQRIIISHDLKRDLSAAVSACRPDRVFVLADEHTAVACWPKVAQLDCMHGVQPIVIGASDVHKTLETLAAVWRALGEGGATRHSCLVCLGGGMVTDLGGFAASTFKRGISFVHVPTTLLAMVDASVGGKTGINFGGLKNEVGLFSDSRSVVLDTQFLDTLDTENIRSGYAEMIKHGLISGVGMWAELLRFDLAHPDLHRLQEMVAQSVQVKERIVASDPTEQGQRKVLNLGHTVGHALESWALSVGRPILHGYAVAYGLVCELYLSHVRLGFPLDRLRQTAHFIKEYYGNIGYTCDDYPALLALMRHDKKNVAGSIRFALLADVGVARIDQAPTDKEIMECLDFYREGL